MTRDEAVRVAWRLAHAYNRTVDEVALHDWVRALSPFAFAVAWESCDEIIDVMADMPSLADVRAVVSEAQHRRVDRYHDNASKYDRSVTVTDKKAGDYDQTYAFIDPLEHLDDGDRALNAVERLRELARIEAQIDAIHGQAGADVARRVSLLNRHRALSDLDAQEWERKYGGAFMSSRAFLDRKWPILVEAFGEQGAFDWCVTRKHLFGAEAIQRVSGRRP